MRLIVEIEISVEEGDLEEDQLNGIVDQIVEGIPEEVTYTMEVESEVEDEDEDVEMGETEMEEVEASQRVLVDTWRIIPSQPV